MRILHTSDWHIGRRFFAHPTLESFQLVIDALASEVRDRAIDVVVVSGDIFDSTMPAAECYTTLSRSLRALREAGAAVVLISGNHDSAVRLGFHAEFAALGGIHTITGPEQIGAPVTIPDGAGPVHFYGIPFLEPSLVRHLFEDPGLRTHQDVLAHAMGLIAADRRVRGGRSVVLAHCFAAEVPRDDAGVERDITAGGVDLVSSAVFDGPDYVALGHIHGRSVITERIRYSGAPLHYAFSEGAKPRGGWLVELNADGLGEVCWIDLPIPRRLSEVRGELEQLLADPSLAPVEGDWVDAVITDRVRPMDAMRRLQERFPGCVHLRYEPSVRAEERETSYSARLAARGDHEIVDDFLGHVRNGAGASPWERERIAEVLGELAADAALA